MSILRLAPDQRYEIALQYVSAKESNNGHYGKQFLYTLASPSDHVLYVPPVAHAEIQSLHLEIGEVFAVTKSIGPNGAHAWEVERVHIEAPIAAADPVPVPKPVASARSIAAAPKSGPVPDPPTLTTDESRRIFRQLVATIQACQAAELFSRQINYPVSFGPEDIRAMAISGFIAQSRREAA